MSLHFETVAAVEAGLVFTLGLLLLFTGLQNRTVRALPWWGAAYLAYGGSITMLMGAVALRQPWLISLGWMVNVVAVALMWSGARRFDGRPVALGWMCVGPLVVIASNTIPGAALDPNLGFGLSALVAGAYMVAAAFEIWRGREEPLVSRWPAIVLLVVAAAVLIARVPLSIASPIGVEEAYRLVSPWLAASVLASLVCEMSIAFLVIAMAKERLELHQMMVARIDPLTGLGNRRAFMALARRRIRRERRDGTPIAALMFDLDRFKRVNDRFGHALGDQVLCRFAAAAHQVLRPTDIVGRIGGEEFAALLSVAKPEEAVAAAERVRAAFAAATRNIDGHDVGATVSIGVAIAEDGDEEIKDLLCRADEALYRAKTHGRDRVEVAVENRPRLAA